MINNSRKLILSFREIMWYISRKNEFRETVQEILQDPGSIEKGCVGQMDVIREDTQNYAAFVFRNARCMMNTTERVERILKTVRIDNDDPRIDTVNAIADALPIIKAQAAAWTEHGQRLEQFLSTQPAEKDDTEQITTDCAEETANGRIVFALNELKRISELCENAGSLRNGMIRYLNRKIQTEGTADRKEQQLLEELVGPGIEIGYLSDLWKQVILPRILWRMYLQNHVLLEVRKQKEIFLLSSVLLKFIYKTSEEGSNFRDCALADGENVDTISAGRCAYLADDYGRTGLLKRKNDLNILYETDPVVEYICAHGMRQMWDAASEHFLEELESGYDESNAWVMLDDLCKMAYAMIGIETSHMICFELSKVLWESFRMFDVRGYSPIAAMILNCGNKLHKYLCKYEGKQRITPESKAAASKRQELDRIFAGGKRILEACRASGMECSPIYYGYMSILSPDQKDTLTSRYSSTLRNAARDISTQYNDLVSKLDSLGHNSWESQDNDGLYRSRIVCEDEPLLYFEPNVGRSWGDLSAMQGVLCSICEKLDGKMQQETEPIKRNELNEIYLEMEETASEFLNLCKKTGDAIFIAEEKLTRFSDRADPIEVLRLIHPGYPYSRELLSWRYGTKTEPLAIQDIQIQNGYEGAAYTVSSCSAYGFCSVSYDRHHKEIGYKSGSFVY